MSETEAVAWSRARRGRLIELGAAIVAGGGLVVMFVVFYTILTR